MREQAVDDGDGRQAPESHPRSRSLHKTARYAAIMGALEGSGSCTVAYLTRRLGVSDETVRRDIKALAARGLV